jgi:fructosamine-3-kinase
MSASTIDEPEDRWERPDAAPVDVRAEVERRLGPVSEPLELLGGRNNVNVRIGNRVLRIYGKDRAAGAKEAALLSRPWKSFVVPEVLERGEDFVVLRHVEHRRIEATTEHGAAIGRALAEIHAVRFDRAGFLDEELRVVRPLPGYDRLGALGVPIATMLSKLKPPVLVHGDFKTNNLRWTDRGLLILDWEAAVAGPALFDLGALVRWWPPSEFVDAFVEGYGALAPDWRRWADAVDLINLAGKRATPGSQRAIDLERRISTTLAAIRG